MRNKKEIRNGLIELSLFLLHEKNMEIKFRKNKSMNIIKRKEHAIWL